MGEKVIPVIEESKGHEIPFYCVMGEIVQGDPTPEGQIFCVRRPGESCYDPESGCPLSVFPGQTRVTKSG